MSWFRNKLGFPKKDKENGDPNISRCRERYSVRGAVWDNSRNLDTSSFRNSVTTDLRSKPLPPAPYSVVTEPKTTKASRSCPGGSDGYHYQPPMNRHYPTSEAPMPPPRNHNQSKLNETQQSEREHRYANVSMHSNYRSQRNHHGYGARGTSEYESGSNDPSPTITYESRGDRRSGRRQRVMIEANTSNSEYDSEAEDPYTTLVYANKRLEKENSRLRRRRHETRENLYSQMNLNNQLQEKVNHLHRQCGELQEKLRHQHEAFQKKLQRLHHVEAENEALKRQLAMTNQGRHHGMAPTMTAMPGMTTVESRSTITGAGEALCSRSTSNTDLLHADADARIHSSSSATPPIHDEDYDEDETKNFRQSDDEDVVERPRSERSPVNSDCDDFNGNELGHHGSCVLTDEDDMENANAPPPVAAPLRTPLVGRSPLRRSYSETDIRRNSTVDVVEMVNQQKEEPIYISSVDPIMAGYSSSFSSDEDKARAVLLWKQLSHKGSVVRNPRRRRAVGQRNFRCFGPNERAAISSFDYLQDLSTDISCLEATPGQSPDFK
uniref:BZIP domain-containing protein n=1 Tax=Steinernema glaseri TaxID=37863 RepID=A0A1I7XZP6_9BILA